MTVSRRTLFAVACGALVWSVAALADGYIPPPSTVREVFGGLGPVPTPAGNPVTSAKVALGERLFNDTGLSGDGKLACASCHPSDSGFAAPSVLSPAATGKRERRHAPSLINVAYVRSLLWDGRLDSLDSQPIRSFENVLHLNHGIGRVIGRLAADTDYPASFVEAFGDGAITGFRIGQAIGAYERTLVFDDSPFDRYMAGDEAALDGAEKRGLGLFMRDGRCITCHFGPNLSDGQFHNIAVPDGHLRNDPEVMAAIRFDARRMNYQGWAGLEEDPGRALVTADPSDVGKFRTMTLRNIAETAPYMHNGAYATLEAVVAHYNRGGGEHPNKSRRINPLELNAVEQADLVAFLKALTGRRRPWN